MTLIPSLDAMASTVARAPRLVLLREVIDQLARRLHSQPEPITRHVLQYLRGPGAAVAVFTLGDASPVELTRGANTREAMRAELRQAATNMRNPAACRAALLQARQLAHLPRERDSLLEALANWWTGAKRLRQRGVAEVAIRLSDAVALLGYESEAQAPAIGTGSLAPEHSANGARDAAHWHEERAPDEGVPRSATAGQLVKGAPGFDQACIALFRERVRLEGTHRPMQRLVAKYRLSDGHLRKCIRHGEQLVAPIAPAATVRSVFELPSSRRRAA